MAHQIGHPDIRHHGPANDTTRVKHVRAAEIEVTRKTNHVRKSTASTVTAPGI